MARLYLETSVISYLAAWPSRDLIVAGHQQITHEWWRTRREHFDLFVSRIVVDEAAAGDEEAARRRLEILQSLPVLELNPEATELARELIVGGAFPKNAPEDALHVALATVHAMGFLLTWNCRHIANAEMTAAVSRICSAQGYELPRICTPEELMGE